MDKEKLQAIIDVDDSGSLDAKDFAILGMIMVSGYFLINFLRKKF